jgi:aminoglycoside/choline kinase family phosphotransferase
MGLFPEWFCGRHLGLTLSGPEAVAMAGVFDVLSATALQQPPVFVHRDYHSRNLLLADGSGPGILDFQDAVRGPVTYDLVSLLKDCYVVWNARRFNGWLDRYRGAAAAAGIDVGADRGEFLQWLDAMGLQRHIKVLGIFARLWHRDGKSDYLADLPRVLDYTLAVTGAMPALGNFDAWLRAQVVPAFAAASRRAGKSR